MNKKLALGIALLATAIIIIFTACVPPMDEGLQNAVQEEGKTLKEETILQVRFINPDGTPYTGGVSRSVVSNGISRSITAEQEDALINYYEIITRIQDKLDDHGTHTGPVPSELYSRVAGVKTQGWASVPVEEDYRYQVLLLEGWKDAKGGDPVLLRSAFGVSNDIVAGVNTVSLTLQNIQVSPRDGSDGESGYRFFIETEDVGTAKRPDYDMNNGNMMTVGLPLNTALGSAPTGGHRMTIALEGAIPLMLARTAATAAPGAFDITALTIGDTHLDNSAPIAASDFFDDDPNSYPVQITRGINIPQTALDNQQVSAEWKSILTTQTIDSGTYDPATLTTGGAGTGKPGRVLFTVPFGPGSGNGSLNSFLMAQDGNGSLFFDAHYYGYSLTSATAKDEGFTRWVIRNGLSNIYYDRKDNANGSYTGGAVSVKFGTGGGTVSSADQATVLEVETTQPIITTRATIALSGYGNDGISFVITPSHPAGAYELWYNTTTAGGSAATARAGTEVTSVPEVLSDKVTGLNSANTYYFAVITNLNGEEYVYEKSMKPGSPIIDLGAITASTTGGLGWTYANGTKTVTIDGSETVTLKGSTSTVKVAITGPGTVILDDATIDLSIVDNTKAISLASTATAVIMKLKGSNTVLGCASGDWSSSNNGAGIEVPSGAGLEIQGPGSLTVKTVLKGSSGSGGPGIGRSGSSAGDITITSGNITVEGVRASAIGTDHSANAGNITITGGTVTATSGGSTQVNSAVFGASHVPTSAGDYTGVITIGGNAVVIINDLLGSSKAFGSGGNTNGASGTFKLGGNADPTKNNSVILINHSLNSTNKAFRFANISNLTPAGMRGIIKYNDAWHVYGSPKIQNINLTVAAGQTMEFYPEPTGLDGNGVPTATLSSTTSSAQQLIIGSGAVLTNLGTIKRYGAPPISTDSNGQYHQQGTVVP
jgi:hypothetical protein